jgi:hypothetical protein
MSYDLKLETTPRHLAMNLCGRMDYQACREAMEVLAAEAAAREFPAILVDLLEMEADLSAAAEHRGLQVQGFRCPDQARAWLAG